ncbi:MAG: diaminopimelate decarboxylase [Desulfovibrio sp.]|jgi:diaminopimelate decarboxylase|nr:diaminopimelate decarboxylase [Desulfovibrio sp.]
MSDVTASACSATRNSYSAGLMFFGAARPHDLVREFGSPLYVYNERVLRERCRDLKGLSEDPGFRVCYSTKANGNPHLLRIIREEGLIADAMSPGELAVLKRAGFRREDICYVCNNVDAAELALANARADHVSVDSVSQVESFGRVNPGGRVMARVNPGIGAGHSSKVITAGKNTKFGIHPEDFGALRAVLKKHGLKLIGLNQHVGSLFMDPKPYLDAARWLLKTAVSFPGLEIIDFGGGFGIPYRKYDREKRLGLAEFGAGFGALLSDFRAKQGFSGIFIIEPGRYIAAECSILLGTVTAVKNNGRVRYAGTDMGFNVLARPMIYDSFHDLEIYPVDGKPRPLTLQTVVGNICETGDVLAKDRLVPELVEGDVVGVLDAGAYGQAMSSNYNQRLRPAEALVRPDGSCVLIRRRDTIEDLLAVYPE